MVVSGGGHRRVQQRIVDWAMADDLPAGFKPSMSRWADLLR